MNHASSKSHDLRHSPQPCGRRGSQLFLKLSEVPVSVCLFASVVRSGDYYLFETDSEEEEEEEKKQEEEKKMEEELPEKSAFQVRSGAGGG